MLHNPGGLGSTTAAKTRGELLMPSYQQRSVRQESCLSNGFGDCRLELGEAQYTRLMNFHI